MFDYLATISQKLTYAELLTLEYPPRDLFHWTWHHASYELLSHTDDKIAFPSPKSPALKSQKVTTIQSPNSELAYQTE